MNQRKRPDAGALSHRTPFSNPKLGARISPGVTVEQREDSYDSNDLLSVTLVSRVKEANISKCMVKLGSSDEASGAILHTSLSSALCMIQFARCINLWWIA